MITASRPLERYTGAIVAFVTFMAPYVYFWVHGRGYPGSVVVIVGLMILRLSQLRFGAGFRTRGLSNVILRHAILEEFLGSNGQRSRRESRSPQPTKYL